jgi:hypothetical protein
MVGKGLMGSRSESVRRWWEHRHALWDVSPGELVALQKTGMLSESLKGYAVLAQEEALALVNALGGDSEVSTQRMLLIQDVARLGLVLRAVMGRFVQGDGDPELASRVASITSARRASLQALGLERISKEIDLTEHLARRDAENRAQEAIGAKSEPVSEPVGVMVGAPAESVAPTPSRSEVTGNGSAALTDSIDPQGADS